MNDLRQQSCLPFEWRSENALAQGRLRAGALDSGRPEARKPDPKMVNALALGHRLKAAVEREGVRTTDDLGARFGLNRNDARNLLRFSLLAPDVQGAITRANSHGRLASQQ